MDIFSSKIWEKTKL